MKKSVFVLVCVLLTPVLAAAQIGQGSGSGSGSGSGAGSGARSGSGSGSGSGSTDGQATTTTSSSPAPAAQNRETRALTTKIDDAQSTRFVRTLTNVQIELTLSDQAGTQVPEKKVVSMIVSSGNWGKIRSAGNVMLPGTQPYAVELNVDARPFVATDGQIQVELTLEYAPPRGQGSTSASDRQRPTGINQSQTVVLQSGKAMVVSQAADPIMDRKVLVEVKATVLK
jgi:hypothetical protein